MSVKSLSYILLPTVLMVPEQVWRLALLFIPLFVFLVFCLFLSFLVWIFLSLLEEVLTLLQVFSSLCENGDFSAVMKDICFSGPLFCFWS